MANEWIDYTDEQESTLAAGWYALIVIYDIKEGPVVLTDFHDGETFELDYPAVSISAQPFDTEDEAEDWGDENDPNW